MTELELIEQQIEELKKKAEALRNNPYEPPAYEPNYTIYSSGDIHEHRTLSHECRSFGNEFRTEKSAKKVRNIWKWHAYLEHIRDELEGDKEVDWNNHFTKYHVLIDYSCRKIRVESRIYYNHVEVYFSERENAKEAARRMIPLAKELFGIDFEVK